MVYYNTEDAEELYNSEEFVILENLYVHRSGEYAVAIEQDEDGEGVDVVEIKAPDGSKLREVFSNLVNTDPDEEELLEFIIESLQEE